MTVRRLSIFHGYPAPLIASWCGVSLSTARRWKRRGAAPQSARRLFLLHRDGKVLGTAWQGWRVSEGVLVDPNGARTSQSQLLGYVIFMQLAAEVVRGDPVKERQFYEL